MSKKFNPFLEAKQYLYKPEDTFAQPKRYFTATAAMYQVFVSATSKQSEVAAFAVQHVRKCLYPHIGESQWLRTNVLNGAWPSFYDTRLFTDRWLDHLGAEFEAGNLKPLKVKK